MLKLAISLGYYV